MNFDLQAEIDKFRSFADACYFEKAGPDILRYTPQGGSGSSLKIGFLALVHGNEILGLPILNFLLQGLSAGTISTKNEIYFGLGNLPAAYADKRFLEKDLNRCFGKTSVETPEDVRARELEEGLLNKIDFLVDLHQTIHPTLTAFFIFQYSAVSCFRHLSLVNPGLPTILQFDAIGDSDSLSTDEYLRSRGGFGLALELGSIGFQTDKFELGKLVCSDLIAKLNSFDRFSELAVIPAKKVDFPVFEITARQMATADNSRLDDKWLNFTRFEKGEKIGMADEQEIVTGQAGHVLFPKLGRFVEKEQVLFHICEVLNEKRLIELSSDERPETCPETKQILSFV